MKFPLIASSLMILLGSAHLLKAFRFGSSQLFLINKHLTITKYFSTQNDHATDGKNNLSQNSSSLIQETHQPIISFNDHALLPIINAYKKQALLKKLETTRSVFHHPSSQTNTELLELVEEYSPVYKPINTHSPQYLLSAVRYGKSYLVEKILADHDFTEYYDNQGYSALHLYVFYGHLEIFNQLINAQAYLFTTNNAGLNIIHTALAQNHYFLLEAILHALQKNSLKDRLINAVTKTKETPLMQAARAGYTQAVILLLNNGGSLETRNTLGHTALMLASESGSFLSVKKMLETDAFINAEDHNQMTALLLASHQKPVLTEIKKYSLTQQGSGLDEREQHQGSQQFMQSTKDYLSVVRLLLKNGAHINHLNSKGESALILATKNNNDNLVQLLLEQPSIDLTLKDNANRTAYDWAKLNDHESIASKILMAIQYPNQPKANLIQSPFRRKLY